MSENVREVLEAAIEKIMPAAPPKTWTDAQWDEWYKKRTRFKQLLDAEAYTDAALMLVPENWTAWEMRSHAARSHFSVDLSRLSECDAGQEDWAHGRGPHPAIALAQAALAAEGTGDE